MDSHTLCASRFLSQWHDCVGCIHVSFICRRCQMSSGAHGPILKMHELKVRYCRILRCEIQVPILCNNGQVCYSDRKICKCTRQKLGVVFAVGNVKVKYRIYHQPLLFTVLIYW